MIREKTKTTLWRTMPAIAAAVALLIALALAVNFLLFDRVPAPSAGAGALAGFAPGVPIGGGPFTLTSHRGEDVTAESLYGDGEYALIYFGYSFCPDICPTELLGMTLALETLPAALSARITPVFISIDPARDTVPVLAAHMAHFHPRMIGLAGTEAAIAAVARDWRVYYARAASAGTQGEGEDDSAWLIDHSGYVYLQGPDGTVRWMFAPQTDPDAMATAIASLMTAQEKMP